MMFQRTAIIIVFAFIIAQIEYAVSRILGEAAMMSRVKRREEQ